MPVRTNIRGRTHTGSSLTQSRAGPTVVYHEGGVQGAAKGERCGGPTKGAGEGVGHKGGGESNP